MKVCRTFPKSLACTAQNPSGWASGEPMCTPTAQNRGRFRTVGYAWLERGELGIPDERTRQCASVGEVEGSMRRVASPKQRRCGTICPPAGTSWGS